MTAMAEEEEGTAEGTGSRGGPCCRNAPLFLFLGRARREESRSIAGLIFTSSLLLALVLQLKRERRSL